jgi:hypothetical protein
MRHNNRQIWCLMVGSIENYEVFLNKENAIFVQSTYVKFLIPGPPMKGSWWARLTDPGSYVDKYTLRWKTQKVDTDLGSCAGKNLETCCRNEECHRDKPKKEFLGSKSSQKQLRKQ